MHPAWIEIDVRQFSKNIAIIKNAVNPARVCLPVKANAYGHGLCAIAHAAVNAGVDYLAVAHLQEAIELRQASIQCPILVLGAIHEDQIPFLLAYDLEFSLSSRFKAKLVIDVARQKNRRARVHLEVDTGMRRTGMRPETARHLYAELADNPYLDVVGIYSHLATGTHSRDEIALMQINAFKALALDPMFQQKPIMMHLANSSAVMHLPESHLDMVRPAMLCFGYADSVNDSFSGIAPCFSLKARVAYFKVVYAGEGISYGHTHVAKKNTRIVTVPVGYGDGYRRSLSNRGSVLIRGKRFPIVGTICMDQFMVDVGDESVFVGDEVVLIGRQGDQEISVKELALLCETIPYEILCLFNDRIPRLYKNAP